MHHTNIGLALSPVGQSDRSGEPRADAFALITRSRVEPRVCRKTGLAWLIWDICPALGEVHFTIW